MTCSGAVRGSGPASCAAACGSGWRTGALLGAGVVPPGAVAVRNGDVGLLHVGEHLLVELIAQAGERGHHGLGVGVFGFEIGGDLGILLVAQPGVVVGEGDAVEVGLCGFFAGDGGRGKRFADVFSFHVLRSVYVLARRCGRCGAGSAVELRIAPRTIGRDERLLARTNRLSVRLLSAALSLFSPSPRRRQSVDSLPKPTDYVSDFAHVLSPEAIAQLDSLCAQLDHSEANAQIAIVTVQDDEWGRRGRLREPA